LKKMVLLYCMVPKVKKNLSSTISLCPQVMQQKMETEEERETTVKNEDNEEESDEESGCAVFSSSPLTPEDPSSPCSQPALIDLSVSHGKSFWVIAV
jgi:hypothetical protein